MIKYFILLTIAIIPYHGNPAIESIPDWKLLTVTKICSKNGKQCHDKLSITHDYKVAYSKCGRSAKAVTLPKEILEKVTALTKHKVREWDKEYYVDSVCGFNIELDNSENYSLDFDANPVKYEAEDIKQYLRVLNDAFNRLQ